MQHFNVSLSRRSLLKAATFGAIAAALPPLLSSSVAAQKPRTSSNPVFYRFRLGNFRAISITGSGILSGPTAGRLQAHLRTLGIRPAEIDTIIITHAHSDHIGGVADGAGKLVFPNARYFVSQIEADFWTDPKVSLPKMKWDEALKNR